MSILKSLSAALAVGALTGLAGCSGNGAVLGTLTSPTGPTTALVSGGAATVYVVQLPSSGAQSILTFPAGGNGALTPTGSLLMPTSFFLSSVAVDASGQIYAGGLLALQQEVLVFAAGSTGAATPTRTILVGSSSISTPIGVLTTDAAGSLYVSSTNGTVWVFGPTATGAATPTRTIAGALTGLSNGTMYGTAVDGAGNIYVASGFGTTPGAILVFGPTATGNVAPTRTITSATLTFYGIAVDASGNIFVAEDNTTGTTAGQIVEFSSTATGAAIPLKTITLSGTAPSVFGGLRLDAMGNLYAVEALISGQSATYALTATGPGTTGNVAPAASMNSTAWLAAGSQLAVR